MIRDKRDYIIYPLASNVKIFGGYFNIFSLTLFTDKK